MEKKKVKSVKKEEKKIKIGKLQIKMGDFIVYALLLFFIVGFFISPRYYSINTGLYNKGTENDKKMVETAMGKENTEERFRIYFQWYNVVHELGHGLMIYNDSVDIEIADEEQLVNDFAVAYWKKYGEEDKLDVLEDIVNYAVVNVGDNYKNGVDYLELGRKNSNGKSFNNSFFNFEDYGWFQFSSVKHSLEEDKDLETVLKEMGIKNFKLNEEKKLEYPEINEEVSTKIINDAVDNFREWGLKYKNPVQHFKKDPNLNSSRPVVKIFGLFEYPDLIAVFS